MVNFDEPRIDAFLDAPRAELVAAARSLPADPATVRLYAGAIRWHLARALRSNLVDDLKSLAAELRTALAGSRAEALRKVAPKLDTAFEAYADLCDTAVDAQASQIPSELVERPMVKAVLSSLDRVGFGSQQQCVEALAARGISVDAANFSRLLGVLERNGLVRRTGTGRTKRIERGERYKEVERLLSSDSTAKPELPPAAKRGLSYFGIGPSTIEGAA